MLTLYASPGTCRNCMRRRNVFDCSRKTGGNYRTPQRMYGSSVCAECAVTLLTNASPEHGARGWSVSTLRAICTSLVEQTNPADPRADLVRDALASYAKKVAEKEASAAAEEERMRPYWDRIAERNEIREWVTAQQHVDGMDERTCRNIGFDIKNGKAGNERTGWTIAKDGSMTYERTMRQQVIDYITNPADETYDAATRAALIDGIRDGLHRPITRKTEGS